MTDMLHHNLPPDDDVDPLLERLREEHRKLHERADDLLAAAERMPDRVTDENVGRTADFCRQISACIKAAEVAHHDEKAPFLQSCRTVDAWLGTIKRPLFDLKDRAERLVAEYQRARELEERQRLEQEGRHEEAQGSKPADLVRLHTGMGGVVSLQAKWVAEIIDVKKLDLTKLRPYLSVDELQRAVNAFVRAGGRELRGCKIYEDRKAVIR